jgi:hypothetical protein
MADSAKPQVSDLLSVTSSAPAYPGTPDPVVTAPATRCGCPDCLERAAHPGPDAAGHDFWDRMILRVVAEEEERAPLPDYEPRFPNWREWLPKPDGAA